MFLDVMSKIVADARGIYANFFLDLSGAQGTQRHRRINEAKGLCFLILFLSFWGLILGFLLFILTLSFFFTLLLVEREAIV